MVKISHIIEFYTAYQRCLGRQPGYIQVAANDAKQRIDGLGDLADENARALLVAAWSGYWYAFRLAAHSEVPDEVDLQKEPEFIQLDEEDCSEC